VPVRGRGVHSGTIVPKYRGDCDTIHNAFNRPSEWLAGRDSTRDIGRFEIDTVPSTRAWLRGSKGSDAAVQVFGENWIIVGLMMISAFAMGMALLILNWVVAPAKPSKVKSDPYESGVPDVSPVRPSYTPRFYVVAMLFVVFDIEAIFIFPWAIIFDDLGTYGFVEMVSFIGLLFLGYIYAWKKGALEWV
jgi:NADH-quinone oxidoreductase subunit A